MTLDELKIIARCIAESELAYPKDIETVARKEAAIRIIMRELKLKTLDPRLPEDTNERLRS